MAEEGPQLDCWSGEGLKRKLIKKSWKEKPTITTWCSIKSKCSSFNPMLTARKKSLFLYRKKTKPLWFVRHKACSTISKKCIQASTELLFCTPFHRLFFVFYIFRRKQGLPIFAVALFFFFFFFFFVKENRRLGWGWNTIGESEAEARQNTGIAQANI